MLAKCLIDYRLYGSFRFWPFVCLLSARVSVDSDHCRDRFPNAVECDAYTVKGRLFYVE